MNNNGGGMGCLVGGVVIGLIVVALGAWLLSAYANATDKIAERTYAEASLERAHGAAQAEITEANGRAQAAIVLAQSQARMDGIVAETQSRVSTIVAQAEAELTHSMAVTTLMAAGLPWLVVLMIGAGAGMVAVCVTALMALVIVALNQRQGHMVVAGGYPMDGCRPALEMDPEVLDGIAWPVPERTLTPGPSPKGRGEWRGVRR